MIKNGIVAFWTTATMAVGISAQSWTDISTALIQSKGMTFPGGVVNCSGVCVNRLTGDVVVKFIDNGMWRSTDRGVTWSRIDNNTVSGRCESGWAVQVDQDNPVRMAIFSLDGTAGWTADGTTWKQMTGMGRNWDFGSVDWATASPKVMLVSAHESNGVIDKTTDGGVTWTPLSVGFGVTPNWGTISMIGVMDSTTFVYGKGSGIQRSTDGGATWSQVSTANPQTRVVVRFGGKHYLGTASGLLVSSDKGATWVAKGGTVNIWDGPFFGADENTMVVAGPTGVYKTANAGTAWTKVSGWVPDYNGTSYDPAWFAQYSWDPINNAIYATRMVCPAVGLNLGTTMVADPVENVKASTAVSTEKSACHVAAGRVVVERRLGSNVAVPYDIRGVRLSR